MTWVNQIADLGPLPSPMDDWLEKPYVLSKTLAQCYPNAQLQCLQQGYGQLIEDEQKALKIPGHGWIREVVFHHAGVPLTYGRVVMPTETYLQQAQALDDLGHQPIGETLLYNDPNVARGDFQYNQLSDRHPLFEHLALIHPAEHYWARRSLFEWDAAPLLITEVFFPTLPDYPKHIQLT